tara:strand:+ start:1031 stop:2014 length:984 start_codon:yes stop_codon:yes gene_type:complete
MNLNYQSRELFSDILGQNYAIKILQSIINKNQFAPAYVFAGPSGIGKKKSALRFFEGVVSGGAANLDTRRRIESLNHPDFVLIEPTYLYKGKIINQSSAEIENIQRKTKPQIRLDQIRDLKRFLSQKPVEAKLNMIVIDDIELINEAAANALLKTLEEPKNGIIILICERTELLLDTILSRCQKITFNHLNEASIKNIINENNGSIELSKEYQIFQKEVLNLANGSPGALLKNSQKLQEIPIYLLQELIELPKDSLGSLSLAKNLTNELDTDQQIWLINFLQQMLWLKECNANKIQRLDKLRNQLIGYVQPRLAWEVTLLELSKIKQ